VMETADGDRVFIADFSADRPRLGEANVMRLGGRPAADDAGLRGDGPAMRGASSGIVDQMAG
jgi:hypothetical protein